MMYNTLNDIDIFRAQPNPINERFFSQSRISYNPNLSSITPGKFNVWYESMFYGCLPYRPKIEKDYLPPSFVASLECCKDLNDREKKLRLQDITIGRWKTKHEFNVINLCFDTVHLSHNYGLEEVNNQFINDLLNAYSSTAGDFIKQIFEFLSSLCRTGRNDSSYYILTALYTALRKYYKTECNTTIDGLISSSAATEGKGLNIVMTPEAVDKCLTLDAVMMYRYFLLMPEAITYAGYPCSEMIVNNMDTASFNYDFKKYIEPSERYIEMLKK